MILLPNDQLEYAFEITFIILYYIKLFYRKTFKNFSETKQKPWALVALVTDIDQNGIWNK